LGREVEVKIVLALSSSASTLVDIYTSSTHTIRLYILIVVLVVCDYICLRCYTIASNQ
jgi:hypothetical protein